MFYPESPEWISMQPTLIYKITNSLEVVIIILVACIAWKNETDLWIFAGAHHPDKGLNIDHITRFPFSGILSDLFSETKQ